MKEEEIFSPFDSPVRSPKFKPSPMSKILLWLSLWAKGQTNKINEPEPEYSPFDSPVYEPK